MPTHRDLEAYHKSIGAEFKTLENRIRHIIGDAHWLTDGEHKEAVLRRILRGFLPESQRVGKGFACTSDGSSTSQIDILIAEMAKPTLFKDGDLFIVTPDVASHIIEVKTKLAFGERNGDVIEKLVGNAAKVRAGAGDNSHCWVGLFAYDATQRAVDTILDLLSFHAQEDPCRVINCVALGSKWFVRFWEEGSLSEGGRPLGAGWALYDLKDLAFAYFISNAVWPTDAEGPAGFAWFPLEGGKQQYRREYRLLRR